MVIDQLNLTLVSLKINSEDTFVNFKKNNILPTRIVTALSGKIKNQIVPFECQWVLIMKMHLKKDLVGL